MSENTHLQVELPWKKSESAFPPTQSAGTPFLPHHSPGKDKARRGSGLRAM